MANKEKPSPSREQALGVLLIRKGTISEEQLAQALDEKERSGRRIGDILIEHG
ncbi:MAG: hypothetical protein ABSC36_03705 [Gaiellaceae bacterium]